MTALGTTRVAPLIAVGRFRDGLTDASAYFAGTDQNDAPVGSTSMTIVLVCPRYRTESDTGSPVAHGNGANAGWRTFTQTVRWGFQVFNGAGGAVTVQVDDPAGGTAFPEGLAIFCASFNEDTLRARLNGVAGTPQAVVGFTPPILPLNFGVRPANLNQPSAAQGLAAFLGTSVFGATDAQLATIEAAVLEGAAHGRDLRDVMDEAAGGRPADLTYYDAADAIQTQPGGPVVTDWAPRVGAGVVMTKEGAPEAMVVPGGIP